MRLMTTMFLVLVLAGWVHGQKFTISGYIEDAATGEKLIAANLYDARSESGSVSNTYGFYSLTLPKDSVLVTFSYIGYQPQTFRLLLNKNIELNVRLESALNLAEVVVTASANGSKIEEETQMSQIDLPVEQIKKVPALLGETDVLKTIQLLPGVQSGGEGQTGLYVRGGSPDQNLILLDGVPVYNVSHVLGIFSVFNADAIKTVTLTKGGFPSRYGGRLSSVLEINMKEGNMQEFHGEGSIGTITSKLTLEGPIWKDKTSFLISGRRTYVDLFMAPFLASANSASSEDVDLDLYFYDLNAKINHKFNDKHRLYLSGYFGADVFGTKISDKADNSSFGGGIDWGNVISAARWNYKINPKLFKNTTLTYSRYNIDIFTEFKENFSGAENRFQAKYFSGIEDVGLKTDFDYVPDPDHYIRFGAAATYHTYKPGALAIEFSDQDFNLDTLVGSQNDYSVEYSAYVEDDLRFGNLKANIGLHASAFQVDDKFYTSFQPRIGLNYLLPNDVALKASFSTMTQYINLLTSEALSLPTDLWVPSTDKIKPQQSWQVAVGAAKTLWDDFELSIEGYYKEMNNVISFKEGASFLFGLENDWEEKVTQGWGESYGLELFFQKKKGRFTGWLGYTLSWNNRQFDDINGGKKYPFRYDRRHDISLVGSYELNKKVHFNAAWVYGTGNAVTLPVYRYTVREPDNFNDAWANYVGVESQSSKNAFRMSDYHRLDLSVEFIKKRPNWERKWVISIYNTYNHNNPYFIYPDTETTFDSNGNPVDTERVFKEVSILPIIPSVSYQFKF
ncbi:MAG: carboxypeptidase-like regulatory domain-containing protein [Saprospiraceae bacterium]|nr:carboxypeptidase-like regulatory domain-containing protein [Saprospiraceae bacterium]